MLMGARERGSEGATGIETRDGTELRRGEPSVVLAQPIEEEAGSVPKGMRFHVVMEGVGAPSTGKERRKTP